MCNNRSMKKVIWILILTAFLAACTGQPAAETPQETAQPTSTPTLTDTPAPSQTAAATDTAAPEPTSPALEETAAEDDLPSDDFSGVKLYRATHLMNPSNFQVSLDNWPEDLGYQVVVFVDGKIYRCDELFPDEHPNRVYCWGPAPKAETSVSLIIAREDDLEPLLEIPFVVPSPGGGG